MSKIGLVAVVTDEKWLGGKYYLQNVVKMTTFLPKDERIPICDVWWRESPENDPFNEVREYMAEQVVIDFPSSIIARIKRKIARLIKGQKGASDLFIDQDISVIFPTLPCCESPGIPFVFWIPDFQYIHLPEYMGDESCRMFERHHQENVAKADLVVLSSQSAFNDYRKVFPDSVPKVRILHFCSIPDETWWQLEPIQVAEARELNGNYFIMSNQFNYYKNYKVVFEAVKLLKDRGVEIKVVCTGNTWGLNGYDCYNTLSEYIDMNNLTNNIIVFGIVPRSEQIALIRRSMAMLQPSLFEGWSTIVEDAKALGKCIIVSNLDVHHEQLGDKHPFYLNPNDPVEWAEAMYHVASSYKPGPDIDAEKKALIDLNNNAIQYARQFISIMKEAMGN